MQQFPSSKTMIPCLTQYTTPPSRSAAIVFPKEAGDACRQAVRITLHPEPVDAAEVPKGDVPGYGVFKISLAIRDSR